MDSSLIEVASGILNFVQLFLLWVLQREQKKVRSELGGAIAMSGAHIHPTHTTVEEMEDHEHDPPQPGAPGLG